MIGGVFSVVVVCIALVVGISVLAWRESEEKLKVMTKQGIKLQESLPHAGRMAEERTMFLLWDEEKRSNKKLRSDLLAPLLDQDENKLEYTWYISTANEAWAPNFSPLSAPITAVLSLKANDSGKTSHIKKLLESKGFKIAFYSINHSVYTDYSEYSGPAFHGWDTKRPRDWKIGTKSPYHTTLTGFPAPEGVSQKEWIKRWHGVQSPMSEIMQPRARYVRSEVLKGSEGAPGFRGFAVEAWPTQNHHQNPFLFFDASNVWELLVNIAVMLRSVMHFSHLTKIQGGSFDEYIFEPLK